MAVLEGDQIKIVKQSAEGLGKGPALLGSLLRTDTPVRDGEPVNALVELAVSMRAHKRGGSLLVVRAGTEPWRDSIIWPAPYLVRPAFPELAELMRAGPQDGRERRWEEALKRFPRIEVMGPPERGYSNLLRTINALPVRIPA